MPDLPASEAVRPRGAREARELCVLVVEDDEADALLTYRALTEIRSVGQVVIARDGLEALGLVDSGVVAPHLALVDLRMPRMDGLDLLMALSGRPELTFPAVVLTSSAASHDAICSRMRGAIRVVTKPDTLAELTAVLSIAIDAVCPQGSELSTRRNAWALAVPRRQRLRGKQSPAAPPPEPKTKTKTNPPQ